MDNILPTNEYIEVDGRVYANPQVGVDETNTFIDNLRSSQGRQNQEIFTDTQMLGTDVPSDLGGLTGAGSYFTSRYQTPQTNNAAANLRTTAQAAALNQVLQDEQAYWKKKYQDAYRTYQKNSYNKSYGSGSGSGSGSGGNSGSGSGNGNTSTWGGNTTKTPTDGGAGKTPANDGEGGTGKTPTGDNNKTNTPPDPEDFYIDGAEQTERIHERTGLPDWLINVMKIFG